MVDVERVRRQARRDVLGGLRRRLGGRPFLHRLRAAAAWLRPSILFEGKPVGTPDAGTYWRVIAEHGVVALFTAPTAFRAIKKEDPHGEHVGRYDISHFRTLFLAGERADPDTIKWAEQKLKVPVIDHWWQTETGSPMSQNPAGLGLLPVKYGSPGVPMPGYDIRMLDDAGQPVRARHARQCRRQAAAAARLPADAVERRPALSRRLSRRVPRLLQDRRRRLHRRGRLSLRHVAHRRHHQRRRPPAVDRRHGGGAGRASRRRRMRGDRHRRRDEGPGAVRLRRAQCRRRARYRRDRARGGRPGARAHRPGRRLQDGGDRQAPAEDALRQDPARHHAEDRRPGSSGRCRQPSTIRPSSTRSRSRSTSAGSGSEGRARRASKHHSQSTGDLPPDRLLSGGVCDSVSIEDTEGDRS